MTNPIDLTGKVALITGAATGIGLGTAQCLAECGASLFLHYRTPRPWLDEQVEQWRAMGCQVEAVSANFLDNPGMAAEVVAQAIDTMGHVDILVNNAAETRNLEPFLSHSRKGFEEMMAINVTAVFLASQAVASHMIERGNGGRIINISSIHTRMSDAVAYATSKGAINALTFTCAQNLAPYGITVNAVAPGPVITERWADPSAARERASNRMPVGRYGTPADIGWTIAFLTSDKASFITGETIFVEGGLSHKLPLN